MINKKASGLIPDDFFMKINFKELLFGELQYIIYPNLIFIMS